MFATGLHGGVVCSCIRSGEVRAHRAQLALSVEQRRWDLRAGHAGGRRLYDLEQCTPDHDEEEEAEHHGAHRVLVLRLQCAIRDVPALRWCVFAAVRSRAGPSVAPGRPRRRSGSPCVCACMCVSPPASSALPILCAPRRRLPSLPRVHPRAFVRLLLRPRVRRSRGPTANRAPSPMTAQYRPPLTATILTQRTCVRTRGSACSSHPPRASAASAWRGALMAEARRPPGRVPQQPEGGPSPPTTTNQAGTGGGTKNKPQKPKTKTNRRPRPRETGPPGPNPPCLGPPVHPWREAR